MGYYPFRITNPIRTNWKMVSRILRRIWNPFQQETSISQTYQQGSQSPVKSENDNEKSKWDLKMNDYDEEESREYY